MKIQGSKVLAVSVDVAASLTGQTVHVNGKPFVCLAGAMPGELILAPLK